MPATPPEGLLDRPLLRQLAGEKFFARGEQYFAGGHVRQLHAGSDRATARVVGTQTYRVKLWRARSELHWSCTCPLGREATFCKHTVAVGLAWLASAVGAGGTGSVGAARRAEEARRERIHQHLHGVDRERLVALLLEATDYDDILRRRLLLESIGVLNTGGGRRAGGPAQPPDLAAYQAILGEAIETGDYVDYEALPDYAQGVEEAIHPLGDLLQMGYAAAVVELAEFALLALDKAAELLDGGDGSLNRTYDRLQHYHLEACRAARPDPAELAARLLGYELEGGLGIFNNAAKTYADVLGKRGLAAWRRLLSAEWSELVKLTQGKPAKGGALQPIDHRRYQLQALMENLAEAEGDVDALIDIKQRDLSSPHDFLSLAELCRSADRHEEALAWAERGLREFPDRLDNAGLRDFRVAELQRQGRHDEALAMAWEDFARFGNLEYFRKLKQQARTTGGGWPPWREKALAQLRERIKREQRAAKRHRWSQPPDHSAVVEILLDERATDQAWAEAERGGCHAGLWLRLAARREKSHPEDALRVYRSRLEPTIARGGQTAYKEAVELLEKVGALLVRLNRPAEFDSLRDEVRMTHRKKRSLIKLLDAGVAEK